MWHVSDQNLNKQYTRAGEAGFNLVELIIAMAAGSLIMLALAQSIIGVHNAAANTDVNGTFSALANDVELVLKSSDLCGSAFVDNSGKKPLKFSPPPGNSEYAAEAKYFKVGSDIILQSERLGGKAMNSYQRDIGVESLSVSSIPDVTPTTSTYMDPSSGASLPANRYTVRVTLTAVRKRGTLKGQEISRSWLVSLVTDQSTNRIVECNSQSNKTTAYRAIAERTAIALHAVRCQESAGNNKYIANTSCTDADGDQLCDEPGQKKVATINHPIYGTPEWGRSYPNRSQGSPPLGSIADEGRCVVEVESNTSTEAPGDIFAIYNADPSGSTYKEGLGCRTDNGWYISGCFRADDGEGDSDINMKKTANAEYCITNDHTQPHSDTQAFSNKKVVITLICMKIE